MTTQTADSLIRDGKRMRLQNLPLEVFWEKNPPRPYLIGLSSGEHRGYTANWEIVKDQLCLTDIHTGGKFQTSENYIGDDAIRKLWDVAKRNPSVGTVKNVMGKLAGLVLTGSASVRRSAQIVNHLGERLLASGKLTLTAPGEELYEATRSASLESVSREIIPVTVETLFPGSNGRAVADWYSGTLRVGEGECQRIAFMSIYECTRLIECRDGYIVGEAVEKNPNYPVVLDEEPPVARNPDDYIQEAVRLGPKFWAAVKTWGDGVDLWTVEEESLLRRACHEKFVPTFWQASTLWMLRLQAEKDGCRIDLLHPSTMHLLD